MRGAADRTMAALHQAVLACIDAQCLATVLISRTRMTGGADTVRAYHEAVATRPTFLRSLSAARDELWTLHEQFVASGGATLIANPAVLDSFRAEDGPSTNAHDVDVEYGRLAAMMPNHALRVDEFHTGQKVLDVVAWLVRHADAPTTDRDEKPSIDMRLWATLADRVIRLGDVSERLEAAEQRSQREDDDLLRSLAKDMNQNGAG